MKYRHILGGACCPLPNQNKSQEETIPNNVIRYTASEKLEEIEGNIYNKKGINTYCFDVSIVNHTFENGVGTIEFDGDIIEIKDGYDHGNDIRSAFYHSDITSIILPNSVTSIGGSAFSGCTGLTSITFPNSVTSIDYYAFENCSGLTSITIPNSVTSINGYAFAGCNGLTSINIGNSVTSIGGQAFLNCTGLTSLIIPENVTSVGGAFCRNCTDLEIVIVLPIIPPSVIDTYYGALFANSSENLVIYVPSESVDTYKSASGWSTYADRIQAIQN